MHRVKILFTFLLFPAVALPVMQAKTSLWDAIKNNDEAGVNKSFESGIDINKQIKKQKVVSTPLLLSVEYARAKMVELIAKKADIDNQGQPSRFTAEIHFPKPRLLSRAKFYFHMPPFDTLLRSTQGERKKLFFS